MAWQGVPYLYSPNSIDNNVMLTLSKLSEIQVKSGFGWDNFSGTVLGAVIGAAIPAGIAFYTIWQNNKVSAEQRRQQVIDIEKAQETQLNISKMSFSAQVLSANRQAWINDLRLLTVDFCSICEKHMLLRRLHWSEDRKSMGGIIRTTPKGDDYFEKRLQTEAQIRQVNFKVRLMLNNNEITSRAMIQLIDNMMNIATKKDVAKLPVFIDEIDPDFIKLTNRFLKVTQRCLKSEWKRVKAGN